MKKAIILAAAIILLSACSSDKFNHDASGTFEATEVVVSAEAAGTIEKFSISEGDELTLGAQVGYIDSMQLYLQQLQLRKAAGAVSAKKPDLSLQISAVKEQINNAEINQRRIANMLADGAATQKQLDDANSQIKVLQGNLAALENSIGTNISSIDKEASSQTIAAAQIADKLAKCRIINPINGTVLAKYVEEKEMATIGKPLYKIADTKHLYLRAYVTADVLAKVKIGGSADVFINSGKDGKQKSFSGKVTWISDKAEFTPKTIQTQDERQNLVYAVKIQVDNASGLIKIGMYGDVDFH